jgi:hypothetical protein
MSDVLTEAPLRRKSLAEQIDRLDRILDGLADGLTGAVTDATRAGARAAIREALVEVLTDPDLRYRLVPRAAAPNLAPCRTRWRRAVRATRARVDRALAPLARRWRAARTVVRAVRTNVPRVPVRRVLAVAVGAGLASAVCALLTPPVVTAVVSGVTLAGSAVVVQLALAWSGARRFRTDGDAIPAGLESERSDLAIQ